MEVNLLITSNSSNKYYSNKQEKLIADMLGWKVVSGSGSRSTHPGDIESEDWLGECKTHKTPKHKIKFDHNVWKKIVDEAASKFKFPVLFVDDGSQTQLHTWCMFKITPGVPFIYTNYILPIRSNIVFDSSIMLEHRKSIKSDLPVIYTINREKETIYISTFSDFIEMFKSYII